MTSLRLGALGAAFFLISAVAAAQPPTATPPSQVPEPRPRDVAAADPRAKDRAQQRRADQPAADARGEATPTAPECAWTGKRIVSLLARDDAVGASDFMPFYLRFGCPEERIGKVLGCIVRGDGEAARDGMAERVARCWDDPNVQLPKPAPKPEPSTTPAPQQTPQPPAQPSAPSPPQDSQPSPKPPAQGGSSGN